MYNDYLFAQHKLCKRRSIYIFACRDWSKNEYFNCTADPRDNPSVERCGVPFSCCVSGGMTSEGLVNIMCGFSVQEMSKTEVVTKVFSIIIIV